MCVYDILVSIMAGISLGVVLSGILEILGPTIWYCHRCGSKEWHPGFLYWLWFHSPWGGICIDCAQSLDKQERQQRIEAKKERV